LAENTYRDENIQSDNPGGSGDPEESKLKRGLDIFGNLFVLNIVFVISCIPLFTIGAGLTALYTMMFKIQKKDDYTVVKEYFKAFRSNFRRSTAAWLIIVLATIILWGQYTYICNFDGGLVTFYTVALVVEVIVAALMLPFVFPLLAYFDNTVGNTFKNALLLAATNLGSWIKMFVTWFAPIFFCVVYEAIFLNIWYLWFLLLFALIAYGTSLTAKKVFDRVAVTQQEEEAKQELKEIEKAKKQAEKEKKEKMPKRSIKEKQALVAAMNSEEE
jgi:uncharacterized membrane protein YesL